MECSPTKLNKQIPWRIHGTGRFTYIYHKNPPFIIYVSKYTSPINGMGMKWSLSPCFFGSWKLKGWPLSKLRANSDIFAYRWLRYIQINPRHPVIPCEDRGLNPQESPEVRLLGVPFTPILTRDLEDFGCLGKSFLRTCLFVASNGKWIPWYGPLFSSTKILHQGHFPIEEL